MLAPGEHNDQGEFTRQADQFRNWVTRAGSSGYPAEPDRYHLYVSLACPWAHRTIIMRKLKKLEEVIKMTVVDPIRDEHGWAFRNGPGYSEDPINGFKYLSEAYKATDPNYNVRVTVPVLWDKKTRKIVSNADEDIMRMFNSEFDDFTDIELDFYPEELRDEIDKVNDFVYPNINDGVYRAGFATTQRAYERAVRKLFDALDQLEARLANQRDLVGNRLTEADWRLFPTLIRFDAVYHGHFKCNIRRIVDYPNLYGYLRDLYQHDGIAETVNFGHIKRHYYITHTDINPTQIVPVGPELDFTHTDQLKTIFTS
ncbi:glutathione S-transferase family protein [Candidatus Poribacteria bacterium]|nr:glutathione S-transferase family protein [Candidatus Poribacteria bacterium]